LTPTAPSARTHRRGCWRAQRRAALRHSGVKSVASGSRPVDARHGLILAVTCKLAAPFDLMRPRPSTCWQVLRAERSRSGCTPAADELILEIATDVPRVPLSGAAGACAAIAGYRVLDRYGRGPIRSGSSSDSVRVAC
jgi:hypothetical protein